MEKVAVDEKARDYWTKYFHEYGKSWVREVPRRIKAALERSLKAIKVEGAVAPLAGNISDSDILSVEAVFKGTVDGQESTILITAEFNDEGKMRKFDPVRLK